MASKVIVQNQGKQKEKSKPPALDLTLDASSSNVGGKSLPSPLPYMSARGEKEKKIGHRRVDHAGQVTYKKKPTSELMAAIQLGIGRSIGSLSSKPERDLLMQDFNVVESVFFPGEGSNITPAHHYSDFRFKTYAPVAFRYFRLLFDIQPDDFLVSLCNEQLQELSNPGASGSVFYITEDDEFIIKTVQHKEAEFLQKLLPGYYMNLNQNPRTLLPKFYGLYCYQCGGKNIRFVVMNNLLPTSVRLHEKYDLKGSTYKRKASKGERAKKSPTLKDLDFMANHTEGLLLESETWTALCNTIKRDCRVLESFKIMDYSLLLGIHNLDQAAHEKRLAERESQLSRSPQDNSVFNTSGDQAGLQRGKSLKHRLANWSTALESIQAESEPVEVDDENVPPGGIPARNTKGERLLLFIGIIDILQSYRLSKKFEHALKAAIHEGDTISVHRPGFYAQRYVTFFNDRVFKKVPCPLKHSPSRKKTTQRQRSVTTDSETKLLDRQKSKEEETPRASGGGRPDLLPTTPDLPLGSGDMSPPSPRYTKSDAVTHVQAAEQKKNAVTQVTDSAINKSTHTPELLRPISYRSAVQEHVSFEDQFGSRSPNHSLSESTTAFTEEPSASYTASSPSLSCESLERDALSAKAYGHSLEDLPEATSSEERIEGTSDEQVKPTSSSDYHGVIVSPDDVTLSDITLKPQESGESVPSSMTLTPDNVNQLTMQIKGDNSDSVEQLSSDEREDSSDASLLASVKTGDNLEIGASEDEEKDLQVLACGIATNPGELVNASRYSEWPANQSQNPDKPIKSLLARQNNKTWYSMVSSAAARVGTHSLQSSASLHSSLPSGLHESNSEPNFGKWRSPVRHSIALPGTHNLYSAMVLEDETVNVRGKSLTLPKTHLKNSIHNYRPKWT